MADSTGNGNSKESNRLSIAKLKNERIKHWAAIVTLIVTNLGIAATAIMAHFKPEKEETAKAAYNELSSAVKKLSEDQIKIYTDISNMRGYLAGLSAREYNDHFRMSVVDEEEDFEDEIRGPDEDYEEAEGPIEAPRRVATRSARRSGGARVPAKATLPGDPLDGNLPAPPPQMSEKPSAYSPPSIGALKK